MTGISADAARVIFVLLDTSSGKVAGAFSNAAAIATCARVRARRSSSCCTPDVAVKAIDPVAIGRTMGGKLAVIFKRAGRQEASVNVDTCALVL